MYLRTSLNRFLHAVVFFVNEQVIQDIQSWKLEHCSSSNFLRSSNLDGIVVCSAISAPSHYSSYKEETHLLNRFSLPVVVSNIHSNFLDKNSGPIWPIDFSSSFREKTWQIVSVHTICPYLAKFFDK